MAERPVYNPRISFDAAPTVWQFIGSRAFVTGIMGPLGSGKSVGCVAKLGKLAMEQEPDADGWRRTRWAVIRNTYPELKTTTIKTWEEVFDQHHCGPIKWSSPITHHIKVPPAGTTSGLDMEILFLALDKPGDIKHLKSLDLTGAWVNEAMEVPYEVIDMLTGRVGRYPQRDQGGATWAGIIMDTNACDDDNWWYRAAEAETGVDLSNVTIADAGDTHIDLRWQFWKQPPAVLEVRPEGKHYTVSEPGFDAVQVRANEVIPTAGRFWCVNPGAENLKYLRAGYYHQQLANKTLEWVQRFMQSKYVYMADGKPWVPEYSDDTMARTLTTNPELPLLGGIDIGGGTLQPAAVVGQRGTFGDWRVLREMSLFDIGIDRFSQALHAMIANEFPGFGAERKPRFWIDPAARGRDEVYELAAQEHLRSRGFDVHLAPTNDPVTRRDALALPMGRLVRLANGQSVPGFMVDKSCHMLRAGLGGKWHRRRMQIAGTDRYQERPEKNQWSHVCEAAGYMCIGGGEHAILTRGRSPSAKPAPDWTQQGTAAMNVDFDIFGGLHGRDR